MAQAKRKPAPEPGNTTKLDDFLCFPVYSTNLAVQRLVCSPEPIPG